MHKLVALLSIYERLGPAGKRLYVLAPASVLYLLLWCLSCIFFLNVELIFSSTRGRSVAVIAVDGLTILCAAMLARGTSSLMVRIAADVREVSPKPPITKNRNSEKNGK